MMKKSKHEGFLIALSLVLLSNPNINLIDFLPDCIAYLLLIYSIKGSINNIPYCAECKDALKKLALFTLIKVPAFFVMYSNLKYGRDIIPLFTLVFSAIELIYLVSAINNCYKMFGYIGERTDATVAVSPFPLSKSGQRMMSVASLRVLTFIFVFSKAILNLLPELMLLTQESIALRLKLNDAYPAVLVLCFLIGIIPGAIWANKALKYLKTLSKSDELSQAIRSFGNNDLPEDDIKKSKEKSVLNALSFLAISSIFTFDLIFENISASSVLPHFIYGLIVLFAIQNLISTKKQKMAIYISSILFVISSIANHLLTSAFFEKHQHLDLKYSKIAIREYEYVKISAILELITILLMLVVAAYIFITFIKNNTTYTNKSTDRNSARKKEYYRIMRKSITFFALPALINVLKCLNVFLKGMVKIAFTAIKAEGFATSTLPWMGTVIFCLCVIYTVYAFCYISELTTEIKFNTNS